MRKIILQEWLSTDGYAADACGTTKFFEDIKWSSDSDADILEQMDSIDTILLGANTYALFVDYWPTADPNQELIANKLNETAKLIFSSSLNRVHWGKWEKPTLIQTAAVAYIKELKEKPGKEMIVWGSLSLAQSLMEEGLIDEIEIRTLPILLGDGKRLFKLSKSIQLETIEHKKYTSGITLNRYKILYPA